MRQSSYAILLHERQISVYGSTMNSSRILPALFVLLSILSGSGADVFRDNFTATNGTPLDGRTPEVGTAWSVTTGAADLVITDNAVDTSVVPFGQAVAFGGFTSALSTGQVLTLRFSTAAPANTGFLGTGGWGGVTLYTGGSGGTEQFFFGKPSGFGYPDWGITGAAVGWSVWLFPEVLTDAEPVVFTYRYDTGEWTYSVGSASTSGTAASQMAFNTVRIASGVDQGETAIKVQSVSVGVVPEPSTFVLLSLGGLGVGIYLNRRNRRLAVAS